MHVSNAWPEGIVHAVKKTNKRSTLKSVVLKALINPNKTRLFANIFFLGVNLNPRSYFKKN